MSRTTTQDSRRLALPEDLVTGEAVALDLPPASAPMRAVAVAFDLTVGILSLFVVSWLLSETLATAGNAAGAAIGLTTAVGVLVGLPTAVETLTRGRSLGKLIAGLRVVRDDGGPVRLRHALIRALLAVVEIWLTLGSVALVLSLADPRGKRAGDHLAGTFVVRDRTARYRPLTLVMPPALAGWAQGADLGRMPDRRTLAVRQFLARAPGMHAQARTRLGVELAGECLPLVAPPPPPGTHPEDFLAALLLERRRRDEARLERESRHRAGRDERRRSAAPLSALSTRLLGED